MLIMNMQNKLYKTIFLTTQWPIHSQSSSSDHRTPKSPDFPQKDQTPGNKESR